MAVAAPNIYVFYILKFLLKITLDAEALDHFLFIELLSHPFLDIKPLSINVHSKLKATFKFYNNLATLHYS